MTTYAEYETGEEKIIITMDVKDLLNAYMKAKNESIQDIVYAEFLPDWYCDDDNMTDDVWVGSWDDALRFETNIRTADTMQETEWQAARNCLEFANIPIIAVWTKNYLYTSDNLEEDCQGSHYCEGAITVKKLRRKINFSESNEPIFDNYVTWTTVVPQPDEE